MNVCPFELYLGKIIDDMGNDLFNGAKTLFEGIPKWTFFDL
jgi:hypothetical protein